MLLVEICRYISASDYIALIHVIIECMLFKIVLKVFPNTLCKEVKVKMTATEKAVIERALDAQHGSKCFICTYQLLISQYQLY